MKEYIFEFRNGDTILKISVKAKSQDSARETITYLLNAPEKFDFTLIEIVERLAPLPLLKKIREASIVYLDGKTIKDRYKQEEVSGVPIYEMFHKIEIESWDEEKRILKLITTNKFEGE
jgi:hypothetical protein